MTAGSVVQADRDVAVHRQSDGRGSEAGHPSAVLLRVADPLAAAGLRSWIGAGPTSMALVAEGSDASGTGHLPASGPRTGADVVVLAPSPMPTPWLRRAAMATRREFPLARIVLIADEVAASSTDLRCWGIDARLPSRTMTQADFESAVIGASGTAPASCEKAVPDQQPADGRAARVLAMLADGHDLAEIAAALFYSERTVKNVLYGYLDEIGARNRVHAVARAIRAGLV